MIPYSNLEGVILRVLTTAKKPLRTEQIVAIVYDGDKPKNAARVVTVTLKNLNTKFRKNRERRRVKSIGSRGPSGKSFKIVSL